MKLRDRYLPYLKNRRYLFTLGAGFLLLAGSLIVNFYAGLYATEKAGNSVTDIILSNTRVYDVDSLFVYGTLAFWAFVIILCLLEPPRMPFTVKSIALFVLIRSVFVSLTHLGPFPAHAVINSDILSKFTFGGDLFFSGHVGLPFLIALIFWDRTRLRTLFLTASVFFGIVVLLAHLHYTIDVLSAFFITYAIYHIAEVTFRKDRMLFLSGMGN